MSLYYFVGHHFEPPKEGRALVKLPAFEVFFHRNLFHMYVIIIRLIFLEDLI